MTSNRTRLPRRDARRLLDGGLTPAHPELTALLAAAARPQGAELAGEEAAVAQFTAAVTGRPVLEPEGTSAMSKLSRKIVAAPLAALGVAGAVVTTGGIALAASQGALHAPFSGHDHRSPKASAATATANPGLSGTARNTATDDPTESTDAPSDTASPSASPSPSLVGLCHAYQAGAGTHNGMTNPAFTALAAAAGGSDSVATYCATLVPPKVHPTGAANATHPAHPTHPARPTQAASPTHPAHPTAPARPTRAASPTHPAQPTLPSQAATAHGHAGGHAH